MDRSGRSRSSAQTSRTRRAGSSATPLRWDGPYSRGRWGRRSWYLPPAARRSTRSSTSRRPARAPGARDPLLQSSKHRTQLEYRMSETGRSTGIHIPAWAERVADSLGAGPHVVVSGISVSGNIHAGNLREVLVAEAVANALRQRGEEVRFIFHADTIDPLRKIAPGIPRSYEEYIGHSLSHIPDPEGCHVSYAEHFLAPFEEALFEMGMDIEVLRSHELYERGVYTEVTSEAMEHTDELREILQDVTNRKMPEHWSPYLPRAASGKLTGMRVLEHLPEQTSVVFADEDGWQDSADYSRGEGKLGWRVELAARWKALGVPFEPFGKDHTSGGGSTDTADRMAREVFRYPEPGRYEYEWIQIKGKGAMSSSKGIVLLPAALLRIMPPGAVRRIILGRDPARRFDIDLEGGFPRFMDEYREEAGEPYVPFSHLVTVAQTVGKDTEAAARMLRRGGGGGAGPGGVGGGLFHPP